GIITLAIASFNYTNLSIARAFQRIKEVGIRKINGSSKAQIVSQFLIETVLFSILALGIALIGYFFFSSAFSTVLEELSSVFTPSLNSSLVFWFLILSIGIGLFAGFLPALYFAGISPLKGINARIKSQTLSVLKLRKVLIGFQLTISMVCVLTIALASDLYKQILSTDMGFEYQDLITFETNEIDPELIANELAKLPSIKSSTVTGFVPGVDHNEIQMVSQGPDTIVTYKAFAQYNFGKVYHPKMISSTKPHELPRTADQILVNPLFLKRLNIPLDSALGHAVFFNKSSDNSTETKYIGGVMNGFVRNALEYNKTPFLIELLDEHPKMKVITVSVASNQTNKALLEIQTIYDKYSTDSTFEPKFVDDQIKNSYVEFQGIMKVIWFLGISIILISVLGQLGIALYNAESRVKEIGIRKVLGAAIGQILKLLLKGTLSTLVISVLIAAPLAYLFVGSFIMPQIAIDAHISVLAAVQGFLGLSIMVVVVIIAQTWRTARLNPSESLKSE
ncbi:MAG: putative ABC transport system permease protein, partial [Roseivirga sp.]